MAISSQPAADGACPIDLYFTVLYQLFMSLAGSCLHRSAVPSQALREVEEGREGEVNDYNQLAGLTEKLRANVHALFMSRAYYLSHMYNRVSPSQPFA